MHLARRAPSPTCPWPARRRALSLWVAAGVLGVSAAAAAKPLEVLHLEGQLLTVAGTPVPDGDYILRVSFYADKTDAKAEFSELATVKVQKGGFLITLGLTQALPAAVFQTAKAGWVGLQVGTDPELPRLPIAHVAYAFRAETAAALACSGCLDGSQLAASVLEPYAKAVDLKDYAKTADLAFAKAGQACQPGDLVSGVDKDGKVSCQTIKVWSGADFALSDQACAAGQVVAGVGKDGKIVCAVDADTTYDGKTFATSGQKCAGSDKVIGIDVAGKVTCGKDADTTYSGTHFAVSGQSCNPGMVVSAIDKNGSITCVQVTAPTGKSFALSNQKCPAGQFVQSIDADGKPVCVADKDTTYDGSDFAIADQKCAPGMVVTAVAADGKLVCAADKDTDTKYDGKTFALSAQSCAAGKVATGVGADGKLVCADDKDTPTTYAAGTGLTLANGAFALDKAHTDGLYVNVGEGNAITSAMVKDGDIAGADLAAKAVTAAKIADGTITGAQIADGSLDGGEIQNGTIGADDIIANQVQRRVGGTCPAGQAIREIKEDGQVTCQAGSADASQTATLANGNWYRVATLAGNQSGAVIVALHSADAGVRFRVGVTSGNDAGAQFTLLSSHRATTLPWSMARVVRNNAGAGVHIDVKAAVNVATTASWQSLPGTAAFAAVALTIQGTSDTVSGWVVRSYELDRLLLVGNDATRFAVDRAGNVGVGQDASASYRLAVNGATQLAGTAAVTGALTVGGTAAVTGALSSGNLTVSGTSALKGHTSVTGNVDASGTLSISGTSTLTGNVGVGTAPSGTYKLNVNGNGYVAGTWTTTGNVAVGGTLNVTGIATLASHATIGGNATVNGTTTLKNSVTGHVSGGALRVQSSSGYLDLGAQNDGWAHLNTDRPKFYLNKGLHVDEGIVSSYDEDLHLQTSGTTRLRVSNSSGNVGVGADPHASYKLYVNGAAYINGVGYTNGNHTVNGTLAAAAITVGGSSLEAYIVSVVNNRCRLWLGHGDNDSSAYSRYAYVEGDGTRGGSGEYGEYSSTWAWVGTIGDVNGDDRFFIRFDCSTSY